MKNTKFVKSSVLGKAFQFGRNTVYIQEMSVSEYDAQVDAIMASTESPTDENIRTAVENQIEDGFEFEQSLNLA